MAKPSIVIVSPTLADANTGNWHTARRWQHMLASWHPTRIAASWPDAQADDDAVLLALHARRSAPSIAAWAERHRRGLAVVLTGTDLYRDLATDADAQRSLVLASRLVVLHARGINDLPTEHRAKARVILQSATPRQPLAKSPHRLRAVMVGHLRDEKAPDTLMAAARLLQGDARIHIDHIGAALAPAWAEAAQATQRACPRYRWLGNLPHEAARRAIQRAHVLVNASRMEGGAQVVIEALASDTPVIASRIPGHVGLLGADWPASFEVGDAAALAMLLASACENRALLEQWRQAGARRAPRFAPAAEADALHALVQDLLDPNTP
jgi:putative glycosyltransferase (TIGR04348 family)